MHPNEAHFRAPKEMAETSTLTIATWNVEWATPGSDRGSRCAAVLADARADISVVTEGFRDLLPPDGYTVDAGPDWGYPLKRGRRKVIVWSRFPLTLELAGDAGATRGRLVMATVTTPHAPIRVIGICIPWHEAHVRSGRRDAQPWSEHMDYLDRLQSLLGGLDDDVPTVVAGDFNQRIPRVRQPIRVFDRLREVLSGWTIHTAGAQPNGPHIDHIATNRKLTAEQVHDWAAADHLGRLSDHAGVSCRLADAGEAAGPVTTSDTVTSYSQPEQENHTMATDDSHREFDLSASDPVMTPQLRAEIEGILRRTPGGFEHGLGFQLRERGLNDNEIINMGSEIGTSRRWLNSLDRLLNGARPTSESAALDTSYAYRELFNHPRSAELDRYARAWLHELKKINPDKVSFEALKARDRKYKPPQRKPEQTRAVQQPCPECGTIHRGLC